MCGPVSTCEGLGKVSVSHSLVCDRGPEGRPARDSHWRDSACLEIDELNVSKKSIDKERGDKENRKGQGGRRRERRRVLANEDAFLRQKGGLCK